MRQLKTGMWGNKVGRVIIRAARVVVGEEASLLNNGAVVVEGSKIVAVAPAAEIPVPQNENEIEVNLGDSTLLPGLIDVHTHLMLGYGTKGRKLPEIAQNDSNDLMLVRSIRNALTHMSVGVTTLRDCGCRDQTSFSARDAVDKGVFFGPRILAAGRAMTITGGHLFFCNGEADGVDGVRKLSRQLLKEGADFIKIMASGGSSTPSTDRRHSSFSLDELKAIVAEARRVGKLTAAHCHSKKSIRDAIAAGIDSIEHCSFVDDADRRGYDEEAVEQMAEKGIYVSPCIQTMWRDYEELKKRETELTPVERARMVDICQSAEIRLSNIGKMNAAGVKMVAGTDSMAVFGDYALGLTMMSQAGFTNKKVIQSATIEAARAIGVERITGSITVGKEADLIACAGNPLDDVSVLNGPSAVIKGGKPFILPPSLKCPNNVTVESLQAIFG